MMKTFSTILFTFSFLILTSLIHSFIHLNLARLFSSRPSLRIILLGLFLPPRVNCITSHPLEFLPLSFLSFQQGFDSWMASCLLLIISHHHPRSISFCSHHQEPVLPSQHDWPPSLMGQISIAHQSTQLCWCISRHDGSNSDTANQHVSSRLPCSGPAVPWECFRPSLFNSRPQAWLILSRGLPSLAQTGIYIYATYQARLFSFFLLLNKMAQCQGILWLGLCERPTGGLLDPAMRLPRRKLKAVGCFSDLRHLAVAT